MLLWRAHRFALGRGFYPDAPVYCEQNSLAFLMEGTPTFHPVQLYATIINILLCLFLIWLLGKAKQTGTTSLWYFLIYPVYRFGAEMIRGDNAFQAVQFGLTIPQWTAVIITAWAVLVAWAVHVAGRRGLDRTRSCRLARLGDHSGWGVGLCADGQAATGIASLIRTNSSD